tara:strand:+ start:322 stop:891 length:570 start_codon:yes stop_codon:yes gene_type:complete
LKKIKLFFVTISLLIFSDISLASEKWILDKSISSIEFELPVLFAKNVKGKFNTIEGFVEIDLDNKKNNKAMFSVAIADIEINYKKYKNLLLSEIFFDEKRFPIALVDTRKFSYSDQKEVIIDVEFTIKGKSQIIPLTIKITQLAKEVVQIQSDLEFSRTDFEIGIGSWKNTSILKDKVRIKTNLFLFKG